MRDYLLLIDDNVRAKIQQKQLKKTTFRLFTIRTTFTKKTTLYVTSLSYTITLYVFLSTRIFTSSSFIKIKLVNTTYFNYKKKKYQKRDYSI